MTGPLTIVLRAARAMSRQRGGAQHGGSSVGNSAAWLVSSLLCYALLVLCHGSVVGPSTPFHGCWWF
jgi:hypothetical protein